MGLFYIQEYIFEVHFSNLNELLLNITGKKTAFCLPPLALLLKQGEEKYAKCFSVVFHTGFICIIFVGGAGSWHQFGAKEVQLGRPRERFHIISPEHSHY